MTPKGPPVRGGRMNTVYLTPARRSSSRVSSVPIFEFSACLFGVEQAVELTFDVFRENTVVAFITE